MASQPLNPAGTPGAPSIPLTPEQRAAYRDLYEQLEIAIENSNDPGVHGTLLTAQQNVENVIYNDDQYRFQANTALYDTLAGQISDTNTQLKTLQTQIQAVSAGVSTFASILAAVDKVLTLVPGA
jgi:hypothetical protein